MAPATTVPFIYSFFVRNAQSLLDICLHIMVFGYMATPSCKEGWKSEYVIFIPY